MVKRLETNISWCKGCGICAAFCAKNVLGLKDGKVEIVNADACVKCGICESLCPDFAIYLVEAEEVQENV
ncbi:MAG: 4Fe-4S dicluster domain-containing protein [Lachnospiraceae bacterium]|jgi:2-oxoglutarate ferredoxin oxidoreductase subunit delta